METMDQDEYEIPLRDQRFFGAGLKRKRVQFVPSKPNPATAPSLPSTSTASASERYLSIVFGGSAHDPSSIVAETASPQTTPAGVSTQKCKICHHDIATNDDRTINHESSIVHQICLQHSHPPSHVDRSRKGLAMLQSRGWDPDGRRGLGMEGNGMLHPIKVREKPDHEGLGFDKRKKKTKGQAVAAVEKKPVKLDAAKVRLLDKQSRKRAEALRQSFYGNDDVERYLGAG